MLLQYSITKISSYSRETQENIQTEKEDFDNFFFTEMLDLKIMDALTSDLIQIQKRYRSLSSLPPVKSWIAE